ncbi:MAG TPA: FecR domain-containing protein [Caulobacteraceae bacterium]
MTRPSSLDRDTDLTAAEWAVRRSEGLTPEERAEFHQWLAERPAHWRAYSETDRIWDELAGADLYGAEPGHALLRRRLVVGGTIAASLAAALFGYQAISSAPQATFESGRGEVRDVRLTDGSSVTLGADSAIAVRFERDSRHVRLKRGEAMFDVAHDASRPFDVRAADTRVTVLGTRFTVKAAPDAVRVNVIQGVVRVAKAQSPIIAPFMTADRGRRITRGERLESRRGEPLQSLPTADPKAVAPWTEGRLVYEDASLAEVVADLNRYLPTEVELANEALGEMRVTGALDQDQASRFLNSLPGTLPVKIRRTADGRTVVEPAG